MAYIIYGLFDPRQGQAIRYIGFTSHIERRLKAHLAEAKKSKQNTYKLNWIRMLLTEGVHLGWRQLDSVEDLREAANREIELIQQYLNNGAALTNSTKGGDGSALWTPSMHEARSVLSQRYWSKEEARAHQSEEMERWWASSEGEEKKRAHSDRAKAQLLAKPGYMHTETAREKMRAARLGKPHPRARTAEWNAKIGAAQAGRPRPQSDETKAIQAAAMKRPETRERMRQSALARRARERAEREAEQSSLINADES